jgi:hypothetical protein
LWAGWNSPAFAVDEFDSVFEIPKLVDLDAITLSDTFRQTVVINPMPKLFSGLMSPSPKSKTHGR